jgi:23S rRNA (cytosine1962-C5)-methyltransferase
MNQIPVISLRKGKEVSLLRRHPWVFSGAIYTDTESLSDGQTVEVQDAKGNFLAMGHFQHATIAVRVLSYTKRPLDLDFFIEKLGRAWNLRINRGLLNEQNNIFRWCHGEGDLLPGLIIDFYNGAAVIQCHSFGMSQQLQTIASALKTVAGPHLIAIYNKSGETLSDKNTSQDGYLHGDLPTPHLAIENGVHYEIDWVNGQKTGFFIDQRENRSLLGKYAAGKKVLNTFCYSGGFSLQALQQGASVVHSLDSSKKAIVLTEANVQLNKFEGTHHSIVADAMEYMKNLEVDYDIMVLDPPAFAKHRDKRHQAVQGYKRLNAHAIRQIKPGGIIFTFSCSQVVDKALFNNTIIAAAIEAGREVKILEQLHQPADHPINAFHPEGEYLKGLVIQVD